MHWSCRFCQLRRSQRFVQDGFQQAITIASGVGKLHFQVIAQSHKLIYLSKDAFLLSKGR
ncbi:hypothetical protein AQ715_21475 [Burkholderia pseudomallei]|nr:hypothetical protein AQ715_21475 [Burkholderia pseudomallei]